MEEELSDLLTAEVEVRVKKRVKRNGRSEEMGEVAIQFGSLEELNGLIDKLRLRLVIADLIRNPCHARPRGPWMPDQSGMTHYIEKIFPGFMMFFGSSARLIVRIMSTAPGAGLGHQEPILCRPTPCSPVQVPSSASARATSS